MGRILRVSNEPRAESNSYERILSKIFFDRYKPELRTIPFSRDELVSAAEQLDLRVPRNIGDIVYSFRYRNVRPARIMETAPDGTTWIIRPAGRGQYVFSLVPHTTIAPNQNLAITKILDSTPGIVGTYAVSDEQALLARLRYNRLIDTFLGITCYSLQNHLRTTVPNVGQVETDEIYVGVDKRGAQYVIPVQAKTDQDEIGRVQLEQDIALCADKWPHLLCRPVGAQRMSDELIALFEFVIQDDIIRIVSERHYQLVDSTHLTSEELDEYRNRPLT